MKVTTFSSTSDERWNISSPEVFPYFLLPPVDDTGAFKDGENALWLLTFMFSNSLRNQMLYSHTSDGKTTSDF